MGAKVEGGAKWARMVFGVIFLLVAGLNVTIWVERWRLGLPTRGAPYMAAFYLLLAGREWWRTE